jgi:glucose/arabinose dehydrogenase
MKIITLALLCLPTILLAQVPANLHLETLIQRDAMPAGLDKGLVAVRNAGDGTNRLFLLEQDGQVWAWDGDQVHSTPFLDIKSEVTLDQYSGLFGLVFHPDYATNGHFFVNYTYTTDSGAERMRTERFTVLADDPNLADLATRRVIIEYENNSGHHNGGDIAFGPDGFLYIAMGDSGGQEDPFKAGQDTSGLAGTIMRIDPDGTAPKTPNGLCGLVQNYAIPPANPFANSREGCDEIWAFGLRNPWRMSFDRATGDLFISDVGQWKYEEVNVQPAASKGGENYGWDCKEAGQDFTGPSSSACPGVDMVDPQLEYDHSGGQCSITGGYRYRGAIKDLQGIYIYADLCSSEIFFAEQASTGAWNRSMWSKTAASYITSFGEDEAGEVLIVQYYGDLLRFAAGEKLPPK